MLQHNDNRVYVENCVFLLYNKLHNQDGKSEKDLMKYKKKSGTKFLSIFIENFP